MSKFNPSAFLAVFIFLAACNSSTSPGGGPAKPKPKTTPPDLPHMWVPDSLSIANEQNYIAYPALLLGMDLNNKSETDSIYFSREEFIGMIDTFAKAGCIEYVDVYFAAFGKAGTYGVPSNDWEDRLVPLFKPVLNKCGGGDTTYYLLPENGAGFDPQADHIPYSVVSGWLSNYNSAKLARLNALINRADRANHQDMNMANPVSNTLHVAYKLTDLQELDTEINYQKTLGDTITGFKIFMSSFNPRGSGQRAFANRIYPQFEFTMGDDHQVFRIDPRGRTTQAPRWKDQPRGLDNGQMCPPTCTP